MTRIPSVVFAAALLAGAAPQGYAQQSAPKAATVPVTVENFSRAESHRYLGLTVRQGSFGKFFHRRELPALDKIIVVRANRDTLYSTAVFDLDAGPVTVTLPEAGSRFRSMLAINENEHVLPAVYDAGRYTYTREQIGTRYVLIGLRTLVDPASAEDMRQAAALQDATQAEQKNPGRFELPNWDPVSLKKVRDALTTLGHTVPDSRRMFGTREQVDPVRHLVGSAIAWGGNEEKDALYLNVTPTANDGATVYRMRVKDVPVNSFWSISVYDAEGWFRANPYQAYTLNNITAKKGADGSVAIQFGGCDGKGPNCLPTVPGWNYMVRLYRPRAEILNGQWTFPQAEPAPL